jgi:small subunit ribosomal protein S6
MRRRMATEAPIYDLTLLLDSAIDDDRRLTILANVEDSIDRAGEIVSRHDWGVRTTAYEVRKRTDADYHLLQFHGPRELLEQLEHNLKITDGVLRFRIIKLRPGTPPPPDLRPAAAAPEGGEPLPIER